MNCNLTLEDRKKFCVHLGLHCVHRNDDGTTDNVICFIPKIFR